MSLDAPSYVVSLQNNIRSRPIPWDGAVRAKTITEADLKKIKTIDKVRKEQRKQALEAETSSYVELFLGTKGGQSIFESAAKRTELVVYLLVLLDDSIEGTITSDLQSVTILTIIQTALAFSLLY
jgi:V-type H+-transporting ATPase subunit H